MNSCIQIFKLFLFFLLLFPINNIKAQENVTILNSILIHRKQYNILKTESLVNSIKNKQLKNLFLADIYFQKSGVIVENEYSINNITNLKEKAIAKYLYADLIKNKETNQDSLVFSLYTQSFKEALFLKDTLLINSVLPKINRHFLRNGNEIKAFKKYINLAKQFAKDSVDHYHYHYYKIGLEMRAIDVEKKEIDTALFNTHFFKGMQFATTAYFKGYMQQFKGIYFDAFLKRSNDALTYYNLAVVNYKKDSLYYSIKGIESISFNKAIIYFENKDYKKSITLFKSNQKIEKNKVYIMYGYEWLYKNYEALKNHDSAYYYFKKMIDTKDEISQLGHALDIKEIEAKYDITKKEDELKLLSIKNKGLSSKLSVLLPAFIFVIIILGIVYMFFKKFRNKSGKLEEEQSETIKRLEELKNIVTKDYIVLKDKTKVYVDDLMYIKSDDHYLRVYLNSGKSNFVRGKLTQINDELPPNFKKCHRSYIINENYIFKINTTFIILKDKTEIPLSRSFKNSF